MAFIRHRSSAAAHPDRLSYVHGPDQTYSTEYLHTFDPRKNLNDLFQSAAEEDVRMENLRVYLRLRPSLAGEVQQDEDTQVHITDARSVILTAPSCSNTFKNSVRGITKLTHKFTFTHVYGPATTQEELFQSSTFGLITDFISGQNCLLFTYGATNSGKTFTVQGTQEDAGLLPRTVQHIFTVVGEHQYPKNDLKPKFSCNVTRLEEQDVLKEEEKRESIFKITSNLTTTLSQSTMSFLKASICDDTVNSSVQFSETSTISHNTTEAAVSPALDSFNTTNTTNTTTNTTQDSASPATTIYAVFISFAEIYNEYIFDLLEKMPTSKGNKRNPLMLGEDYNGSVYIKGLNEVRVRTPEEALQLVSIGRQNLHFAATRLNHHSSRSHCIFTVKLVRLADADNPHVARVSVLSLCDLAGAERAAKTSSSHDRLKESGNINTSLLTLSRCIEALRCNQAQKGSKKMPVPYRDSKLTRLFQSFLLGRGKAAMMVNISKMPLLFDETLQVLKFSAVAKQVAISQASCSELPVAQPKGRKSRLYRMMRQSLKGSGRLSVPWEKTTAAITFGESACEEMEEGKREEVEDILEDDEDDEEEEDERVEGLVQLIGKLKEELVREHKEKQDLEERLRQELCKEFSQQLVEIQQSWGQRLRDQENRYEELTECKIQALMKSVKKCNKRKRFEEDPDEEYVSSVFLFREQQKVEEQKQRIDELEDEEKLLKEDVQALRESQKKTKEVATQAQMERSRLTFRLAQLTSSYDQVVQELEESKSVSVSASTDNAQVMQEVRARSAQLAEKDQEIQELKTMLLEASECYITQEKRCASLENMLQLADTRHMMDINELENQVEGSRGMLSQQATQVEEREQDLEELRHLLSQERKLNKEQSGKKEQQIKKMEEDHIREKSKLLLEMAGLKRNKPVENIGSSEEVKALEDKVSGLLEEKEALKKNEEKLMENQEKKAAEKDEQIKSLEEKLVLTEKQLSEKTTVFMEELESSREKHTILEKNDAMFRKVLDEKESKLAECQKCIQCSKETVVCLEAKVERLTKDKELLSGEKQCLKVSNEDLNNQLEDTKSSLREIEDAEGKHREELKRAQRSLSENEDVEAKLQENFDTCKAELEELQKAHTSLQEQMDAKVELQENFNVCKTELQELQKAHTHMKDEKNSLVTKLQDQISILETSKAETEAKIKEKDDQLANSSAVCGKLRSEAVASEKVKAGQEDLAQKVSELGEAKARLETQVLHLEEENSREKIEMEMLELDKRKMAERLYNLQEANLLKAQKAQTEIQALQEQTEILVKEKIALAAQVESSQRLHQEQASLVRDKQQVVLNLSSKIASLDGKLNKAEQEEEDKKHLEEEVVVLSNKIIRLETKCEMLEKESRAVREARQAEVQESCNRTKDQEDFARQKEMEISTLQEEVKKLLQQSMSSCRSSIAEAPASSSVKTEASEASDELITLKEQLRMTVVHNNTLIQELGHLKTQVAGLSPSLEAPVLQPSASKTSKKKQRDVSTSDKESFVTPGPKEGKGRKNRAVTRTPNTSTRMDSSVGDERQSRDASLIPSSPQALTRSSGRPQRSIRRTMRYDSQEYELGFRSKPVEDEVWEPSPRVTKGSRRTKTQKCKVSDVPQPILQDQENKSSMANKADIIPEPQTGVKTDNQKASSRRRRALYNSEDFGEPFLCDPDLVAEAPPEDSPLTTVRRQLRNRRN